MDTVNDATRISSSSEQLQLSSDVGKESSSPFDTPNIISEVKEPQLNIITLTDFNGQFLDTTVSAGSLRDFRRFRRSPKKQREPKQPKEPKVPKERKQPKEPKHTKEPKFPKEQITNGEKFCLRLMFIGENMFCRQKAGNLMNRIKGKISAQEYGNNNRILSNNKILFDHGVNDIAVDHHKEIGTGYIQLEILDKIMNLFKLIPLKEKNPNQQNKLRHKIIMSLAASEIHVSHNDPHSALKESLLALSPEERAKVLASIPL